ncbi:MAG: hypothetical protein CM1200mP30_09120 [Pseudomonadota bacterium]|nr:MAG: hypothetical protein CM1200mP30_09120 [Pseudomonadota bacterium]
MKGNGRIGTSWSRKYSWLEGDRYEGGWKDGEFHGKGALNCLDQHGDKFEYQGNFRKGKYKGQGTFSDPSGEKYVGEWKDGEKYGQGTYIFPMEQVCWELEEWEFSWSGDLQFCQWRQIHGEYKDGNFHGQGLSQS